MPVKAAELAETYRKRYPRRNAMIDELRGSFFVREVERVFDKNGVSFGKALWR